MPDFSIESSYKNKLVAGVDEAGRGPWAGPVIACAAIINPLLVPKGLDDSKKLSKQKREFIYAKLSQSCDFGLGIVPESVIDQINILEATKLAMRNAVNDLQRRPNVVIIDGNQNLEFDDIESEAIVKGDTKSLSIAAASVIAKVTRDKIMENLDAEFPQYKWLTNQGYGTKEHMEAIEKYGPCKHHRKSFAPIKKFYTT